MSITLLDIAKKTGFSVSTVSRVLHDSLKKYKISEQTRQLVIKTADELGYRPNKLARGLRTNKSHTIGVVVPDVGNPFFATMVKNIAGEIRKHGYNIIVCDADENTSIEVEYINNLLDKRVDGLILAPVGVESSHLQRFRDGNIPVVTLDRCFHDLGLDAVSVDNFRGAYNAVQYLIKEGHQRIAFIQGLKGTFANDERLRGYQQALIDGKVAVETSYIVGDDFRTLNGYLETKSLLKLFMPPTAIFTTSDLIALGALEALREEKILIPQDISLITFDDPYFTKYLSPAITAVAQPLEGMVEIAVNLLFRRMKNPKEQSRHILLEPTLIVRNSVLRITRLSVVTNINNRNV